MDAQRGAELEAVRVRIGLGGSDLWVAYIGLGGTALPSKIDAYLRGAGTLTELQHDVLAQAINEHAVDQGMNHPAPYVRSLDDAADD